MSSPPPTTLPVIPTTPTFPPVPEMNATSPPAPPIDSSTPVLPTPVLPTPALPTPTTPAPSSPSSSSSKGLPPGTLAGLIVGIGIGGLMVLVGVGIFVFFYKRKKRKRSHGSEDGPDAGLPHNWQQNSLTEKDKSKTLQKLAEPSPNIVQGHPVPLSSSGNLHSHKPSNISLGFSQNFFTYEELAAATNDFSDVNLLGQGGFGYVHKGILPDGREVAVKQLKTGSNQGEREFQAEVEIISRIHHKHLVKLVGYCIAGDQKLLVYEFVANSTLESHLHGTERSNMNWPTRMKIALGSAKGLAYLHEDCQPKVIHRDIKASNILIDENFEAKVADFGLAKISVDNDTHISTRVMGTFGYLAPEYAASGKLTEKSDIYSFGVVLLELITGRRPIDKTRPFADDSMVDWARPLLAQALETKNFDVLADSRLEEYEPSEMARMVACAAACIRHSGRRRPQMSQVVRALEGNIPLDDLNVGLAPGHNISYSSFGSSDYDTTQYRHDLQKFKMLALGSSQEQVSSGSGLTSEMQPSASSCESRQTTQEIKIKIDSPNLVDGY